MQPHLVSVLRRERLLWAIVFIFIVLAVSWNLIVPPFESPDEPAHVQFVQFLATHRTLPDLRHDIAEAGIESPQAPLYYTLAAVVLALAGNPEIDSRPVLNSKYSIQATGDDAYRFLPSTHPTSAIHLIRATSLVASLLTILMTFALAYTLTAQRDVALLAAALTAFLPQFTFLAGSVNNDNLAAALGALSMFLIVRISRTRFVRDRDWFMSGVAVGIALLAKSSLLVLLPLVLQAIVIHADRGEMNFLRGVFFAGVGLALSGGWYFARNFLLYGDLVYVSAWSSLVPEQVPLRAPGWSYFWNPFPQLLARSYFGVFGWMNIFLPQPFYLALIGLTFISIVGLWLMAWKRLYRPVAPWLMIYLFVFLTFVSLLVWNLTYIAYQGRLLFPAISALSTLLASGWGVYPSRVRPFLFVAIPPFLLAINFYSIYLVFTMYHSL